MIHIYYAIFERIEDAEKWQILLQQMPKPIIDRVDRYRQELNKYQLVYGRLLLQRLCWDLGYTDFNLEDIQYSSFNKPFWRADIDFSIAHSGNVVACALSTNGAIGLDIEQIQAIDINNFDHILNIKDQQFLSNSKELNKDFFKIWTIKEAVSKSDGRGLSMDVKDIIISPRQATCHNKTWHIEEIDIHAAYKCHFALSTILREKALIKKIQF